MKFFTRHCIRQCVAVCIISIIFMLAAIVRLLPGSTLDPQLPTPQPHHTLLNIPADAGTEQPRDWRQRTNRVVLEYDTDVAQRLKKLAELRTPADHPDTIRLARDLLDPPPDNGDGIKHARYIMKTPQAKAVDEITQKMVHDSLCVCACARVCVLVRSCFTVAANL